MLFKNLALARPRERMMPQRSLLRRQVVLVVAGVFFFFTVVPTLLYRHKKHVEPAWQPPQPKPHSHQEDRLHIEPLSPGELAHFHLLMPAPAADVDFCKTLITASVLGYPVPTLISYNESFDQTHLIDNGSRMARISGVLKWLEALPVSANNDLVMVIDAYDVWFQLRIETLLQRYHAVNVEANERLKKQLGKAVEKEGLKQTVLFGSSKRCSPNQPHTVACYPIPDSPLPEDLYGPNTDTVMGRDSYSSYRQRYLDSGYMIGPIADVRSIFRRASDKTMAIPDRTPWDNGSGGSNFRHRGDDQAIFHEIFGEQEFQREAMRRRHASIGAKAKSMAQFHSTKIEGAVVDDRLAPAFTHEPHDEKPGKPDEFSMGVDYWSDLGQPLDHAQDDCRWLTYSQPVAEQAAPRHLFDCAPRVEGHLPADVLNTTVPRAAVSDASQFSPNRGWDEVALYTNVCLDTIPVMIRLGGSAAKPRARKALWPQLFLQPHARGLMEEVFERAGKDTVGQRGGAYTADGQYVSWGELCPASFEPELFGDVSDL